MPGNFYPNLKSKQGAPILKLIQDFIKEDFQQICDNSDDLNEISFECQDFITRLTNEYQSLFDVKYFTNKNFYPLLITNFETIIYKILYKNILSQFDVPDFNTNDFFFIKLSMLDIDYDEKVNFNSLKTQILNFRKISTFQTPKQKIIILVNLCNFINAEYAKENRIKLTKFLVYMFIFSNIPDLKKQLIFCCLFRHKTVIESDEDYYLSLSLQAVDYLGRITHKTLKMDVESFNKEKKEGLPNRYDSETEGCNSLSTVDNILDIPIDALYNEYCTMNPDEIPIEKYEKLHKDLKILLKLIESNKV